MTIGFNSPTFFRLTLPFTAAVVPAGVVVDGKDFEVGELIDLDVDCV